MRVLVTASAHFAITEDGSLWTPNASLNYHFWSRYLDVYDEVHLLARAKPYSVPPSGWNQASGAGIKSIPLPEYIGPTQFVRNYATIKHIIHQAVANAEAIQLRLPCTIGTEVWRLLERYRPYGIEVIADPYDMFAPGAVKHPLRPFFRWWFSHQLRCQCIRACAAAYVTEYALQRRYPAKTATLSTHYSSIVLDDIAFSSVPCSCQITKPLTLITVGTLDQLYKAPDVLIDAVAFCINRGLDLKLVLVGDGLYRTELEAKVENLGLADRISFCGQLPTREAVRSQLDQADLFVLPSRQEGLPRAMIEAMARGLPCIGSTVGGIPELLPPEDMVQPDDVNALANKIYEISTSPNRMADMSLRNLNKSQEYRETVLKKRRNAFYHHVYNATSTWLQHSQLKPV